MAPPRRSGDVDDQPWLAEGMREERSTLVPRARLFGGGLIAVLLAILVGLGVYFAAVRKSDGSRGYATPAEAPLIAADTGPYKIAPEHPGGAQIAGIDDTIAAAASGRDPGSALLPDTSEKPLPRPVAGGPATAPTDLLAAVPVVDAHVVVSPAEHAAKPIAPAATAKPVTAPPAKPVTAPLAKPVTAPAKPIAPASDGKAAAKVDTVSAANKAKAAQVQSSLSKPLAAKPVDPLAVPADASTRAAKFDPSVTAPTPPKAKTGGVTLQLGAFSTSAKADAAWTSAGSDGALSGLTKRIEPVDRGGTTLYRLRAGGVASPDAARALCTRLKATGAACIVAE